MTKLYKLHYNFDWDKLKPVCEELVNIEKAQMNLVRNGKTSYVNEMHPHTMDEFKPFYDWLTSNIGNEFFVGNSWVNVHHPGGSTIAHDHPNVSMVSAAYLSIPEILVHHATRLRKFQNLCFIRNFTYLFLRISQIVHVIEEFNPRN